VKLYSRRGFDWTNRLSGVAAAFLRLPCRTAVLDGELVLPDENDRPNVYELRTRDIDERELIFFPFDLLYRDGRGLRELPLVERRRRLVRLVARAEIPCLHLAATFEDGLRLLLAAERHGLEAPCRSAAAHPIARGHPGIG
jgi:bifunctional non-homologous end joining protein LigD